MKLPSSRHYYYGLSLSAIFVLIMALFLLLHALTITLSNSEDDKRGFEGSLAVALNNRPSEETSLLFRNMASFLIVTLTTTTTTASAASPTATSTSTAARKEKVAAAHLLFETGSRGNKKKVLDQQQQTSSTAAIRQPKNSLRAQRSLNPHPFRFRHLPVDLCRLKSDIFVLTIVHTAPPNYKRRMQIRETYGSNKLYGHTHNLVLFAMGMPESDKIQHSIDCESSIYSDIIQEDFVDSYKNLTYKGIMWLRYVNNHCPQAEFILKADDDIFVNIFNLVAHLHSLKRHNILSRLQVICLVWTRMKVMRDKTSKWYVTKEEWPHDFYTPYCSGSAYIITKDLIPKMYEKSFDTKFFWVDDVYITGLLVRDTKGEHKNIASLYVLKREELQDRLVEGFAIFGHVPGNSLNMRYSLWKSVTKQRGLTDQDKKEAAFLLPAPRNE